MSPPAFLRCRIGPISWSQLSGLSAGLGGVALFWWLSRRTDDTPVAATVRSAATGTTKR